MKVCLVSRKFDKNSGRGSWIFAKRLEEELTKTGFKVYRIEQKKADEKSSQILKIFHDFLVIPLKWFRGVKVFHFLSENQAIYSFLANIYGAKTITTYHDFFGFSSEGLRKTYFKFIYRMASLSKIIVCNSEKTKKEFKRYFKMPKRIEVVFPLHVRRKNLQKKKGKIVGFLGALEERKRPMELVNLGKLLREYTVEVWGKGPLYKKIKEEIKEKKLNNIHLKGYAPYSKIDEIYNKFNFFVFPTKKEGLGTPIIEAMTFGNPVFILSDSDIPKELKRICIVCKDVNDMAKKIRAIDLDLRKKDEIIKKSYENSKKYSFEESVDKLMSLYKK